MKALVSVRVSRTTYNRKPYDSMHLTVKDETSGMEILDVQMTMEQFGTLLSGLGLGEPDGIEAEVLDHSRYQRVNKKRENKTERVSVPANTPYEDYMRAVRERAKAFETDGWQIHGLDDRKNSHRAAYNKDGSETYTVGFVRWVDA